MRFSQRALYYACSAMEWPVNHYGNPFFEPVRGVLLAAAEARLSAGDAGGYCCRTWLPQRDCERMCSVLGADSVRIRPGAVPVNVPMTAAASVVPMLNASDLIVGHNVDVSSCMQRTVSLAHSRLPRHRTIVGSHFRHTTQSALTASHGARKLHSYCWVTPEEMDFLGWHPMSTAEPVTVVHRRGSGSGGDGDPTAAAFAGDTTTTYFNMQDIHEAADFDEYFVADRRIHNVASGLSYKPLVTVQMRAFFMNQGLLPSDPSDCTWKFACTSKDIESCNMLLHAEQQKQPLTPQQQRTAAASIVVAPDCVPFVDYASSLGISDGVFLAAQTLDPLLMVNMGRLAYLKRSERYEQSKN